MTRAALVTIVAFAVGFSAALLPAPSVAKEQKTSPTTVTLRSKVQRGASGSVVRRRLTGKVKAGYQFCKANRPVLLQWRSRGRYRTIATKRSDVEGRFVFALKGRYARGHYRVVVRPVKIETSDEGVTCARATARR